MATIGTHTQHKTLAAIPAEKWDGYLWPSDKTEPGVLSGEPCDFSTYETGDGPANPFVVEANLYCADKDTSVSVRHIDGTYLVNIIDWKTGEDDGEINFHEILAAPALGKQALTFRQAWIPEPDPACENMNVLTPAWIGFVGFSGKEASRCQ